MLGRLRESEARAERKDARLKLLAEISKILAAAGLDLDVVFDVTAIAVAETLRDGCIIRVCSSDGRWLIGKAAHHTDPEVEAFIRGGLVSTQVSAREGLAANVMQTGTPLLLAAIDPAAIRGFVAPDLLPYIERLSIHSLIVVPLWSRAAGTRRPSGAIMVVRSHAGDPYTEGDLTLLGELSERASLAIDNAELYSRAQEALRLRGEFIDAAAHELRTPLTALKLHIQGVDRQLQRSGGPPDVASVARIQRGIDRVRDMAERLERLVDHLLDVPQLLGGHLILVRHDVDLGAVIREVAGRCARALAAAGCALTLDLPVTIVGKWDRDRLLRIMNNLLSNAIKFGRGAPITIGTAERGGLGYITVRDQGIGIAAEDQARIFGHFERAVSERHYGGFGLGLWVARRLTEAHGGWIDLESAEGRGATFTVVLPLVPASVDEGGEGT